MSQRFRKALVNGIGKPGAGEKVVPLEKANKPKKAATSKAGKAKKEEPVEENDDDDLEEIEKSSEEDEMVTFQKDVSGAIRTARREAGISEQAVADALGVDLPTYIDFEENGGELDITEDGFNKLAKAFKMTPAALATKMLSEPAPGTPVTGAEDGATTGDQTLPPGTDVQKNRKGARVADEKRIIKSAQIRTLRVTDEKDRENLDLAEMPIEKRRIQVARRFTKSMFAQEKYAQIEKSGIITADMFGPNTSIDPVLATELVSLFVDESEILKQVQVKTMTGKKQNVDVMDVPSRSAMQLTAGDWPATSVGTNPLNLSLSLDATKLNFTWIISDDALMTYRGNLPMLESVVTSNFLKALQNDVLDLGINGTTSTYDGSTFTTLNAGWLSLLKSGKDNGSGINAACPAGQIIDYSTNGYTSIEAYFDAILAAAVDPANGNARFFADDTPFLIGTYDWQTYKTQMKASHPTFPVPMTGLPKEYESHPIVTTNKIVTSKDVLYTSLMNLVLGIVTGMPGAGGDGFSVERFRVPNATRMVATVYLDYGIANAKAAVVGQA